MSGSRDIVKRFIGIFIAILLLGYGVVRMGVGALLLAQTLDIVNFPDLAEGVAEVKLFIDARANYQILPFSLNGYFGYILAMGVLLSAGAGGVIARIAFFISSVRLFSSGMVNLRCRVKKNYLIVSEVHYYHRFQ